MLSYLSASVIHGNKMVALFCHYVGNKSNEWKPGENVRQFDAKKVL